MADFQSHLSDFTAEETWVIAASVDPQDKARETAEKLGITYPVGYGLDPLEVSRVTGAYYEEKRRILHATGFLIRPDKTIEVACYSSGPIGRLVALDVLKLVKFYKSQRAAGR